MVQVIPNPSAVVDISKGMRAVKLLQQILNCKLRVLANAGWPV